MTRASLASRATPYGSGFLDRTTGLRFEAHHPQERPDLWKQYLDGAERRYRRHGFEPLLNRKELAEGAGVSLFWVGLDESNHVMAGLRCHGPMSSIEDLQALTEMSSSSEADRLERVVRRYLPFGIIEAKGAWGARKGTNLHFLSKTFFRCTVHAMDWFGAELAVATMADRLNHWISFSGGRTVSTVSVPFPSEKFRTVLVAWRRPRIAELSACDELELVRRESGQLFEDAPAPRMQRDAEPVVPKVEAGWRPIVFRCDKRADREAIARLSRSGFTTLLDHYEQQRSELDSLVPTPPNEVVREEPRFVYFPWRSTLVKMVGPQSFSLLRLDRNRNKITSGEQDQLRGLRIGVVGLSVGHSIAHILAMEGLCGELRLADFDSIETTNLNRIPATVMDLGVNKGVAAARRISEIDPYLPVSITTEGITNENVEDFVSGLDVLIEECDSLDVKVMVREVAKKHRVPVFMETSDRGLFDVERFDLEPNRKLFHGLLGDITASDIADLSPKEKVPYILRILEPDQISSRGAASLAEVGTSLTTWPQLGGDVALGAATVAAAVRRLGVSEPLNSGRVRVDLDKAIASCADPIPTAEVAFGPSLIPDIPDPSGNTDLISRAASLAPSGGNAQPWRFETEETQFAVYLDPSRSTTMDLNFRGSYVAIGAALFNARVVAASQGRLGRLSLFPNGPDPGPVGVLDKGERSDPGLSVFYQQVFRRHTNRNKGVPSQISEEVALRLSHSASMEGATLHLATDRDQLDECSNLFAESDRLRFLTPRLHREMIGELSWPGRDSLDVGVDVRTLGLEPAELATLGIAARPEVMEHLAKWDAGQALGNNTRAAIRSCSGLACITVAGPNPENFVMGGAAVERSWLEGERSGLAVHPISPLFIYAMSEADYRELVGEPFMGPLADLALRFRGIMKLEDGERIALILRLSHAPTTSMRSARLPLDQVMIERPVHRSNGYRNGSNGAHGGLKVVVPFTTMTAPTSS